MSELHGRAQPPQKNYGASDQMKAPAKFPLLTKLWSCVLLQKMKANSWNTPEFTRSWATDKVTKGWKS